MTAISATYSDLKFVRTRKVVQIILECPIEQSKQVTDLLGFPKPDAEQWVGVAPLAGVEPTKDQKPPSEPDRPRKRWSELSRAQRAGIRCGDPKFQQWFAVEFPGLWSDMSLHGDHEKMAAAAVRYLCRRIGSRAELDTDEEAGTLWDALDAQYRQDAGLEAEQMG